jgi:hypothetical protein
MSLRMRPEGKQVFGWKGWGFIALRSEKGSCFARGALTGKSCSRAHEAGFRVNLHSHKRTRQNRKASFLLRKALRRGL